MRRRGILIVTGLPHLAFLAGCQSDLTVLEKWMTGSFTSIEQHEADPENYRDIRLRMVPIWKHQSDGPWLYVEQAAASSLDRPYRQRVYRLVAQPNGAIHSIVYRLPDDPVRYAGAWRKAKPLEDLEPHDLALLEGCDMVLARRDDGAFVGGTVGKKCSNAWGGASYATSEATITETELISWDRGYDADDRQVWGAASGGYIFKKEPAIGASR